jgi:chemotaxis protein MotB
MALPEDDPPPGVPEWVVTYGDMMSLLLTFFIMLVSLSEVNADKKFLQVLESLQSGIGYRAGKLSPPGNYFPLNSMVERLTTLGAHSDTDDGKGGVKTPQSVQGKDQRVYMQRHGKPIPVGPPIYFEQFESQLSEEAVRKLKEIALAISGKPNKIEIRGHTSSVPLPADSPVSDLYHLAYDRARVVFNELAENGVEKKRMRIISVAQHEPGEMASDPRASQADRVQIIALDVFSDDYVGKKE